MRRHPISACCAILILAILTSCAGGHKSRDAKRYMREHDLNRIPRFDIPIEMNDKVIAWMEYFQGPGRGHFTRYLERSGRYIPLVEETLKKQGMPRDLTYLAIVESGFNTQARSRANAVGMWQFIRATGKRYGLRVDNWVDERRDPYLSSVAAAQYLKDLHDEFDDWYLAMAAYNAGEGKIRKAIKMTGGKNFWTIANHRRALRPETRDYVPKYIAAAVIAKSPERFGFENIDYKDPFDFDSVTAETQTDISVIAKCAGTDEETIIDLNPHLVAGATPPGETNYSVRIPKGAAKAFNEKYAALPKDERIQIVRHEVRRGDTLARIARRYGISAQKLASANGLSVRTKKLRSGTTLMIPVGGAAARIAAANLDQPDDDVSTKKGKTHIVRRGETLSKIAARYGTTTQNLVALNNLKSAKRIHTGTKLIVRGSPRKTLSDTTAVALNDKIAEPAAKGKTAAAVTSTSANIHKVKKGETLGTIARRYGTSSRELLALNNIRDPRSLRAGNTIVIRKGKESHVDKQPQAATPPEPVVDSSSLQQPAANTGINLKKPSPLVGEGKGEGEKASSSHPPLNPLPSREGKGTDISYLVKNGDTLWDIARRHRVTISDIQQWNNLSDPSAVKPGTTLTIRQ